jgi:hypothetical protein
MTSFFHDLEDQLRAAARERTGTGRAPERPPSRRSGWTSLLRAAPALAAVGVTVVVAVGALILLGHGRRAAPVHAGSSLAQILRTTPPAQLRREVGYISAATRQVQRSAACRVRQSRGVIEIHRAPGSALLSTLGVLRRPEAAGDALTRGAIGEAVDVYAGATRRALVAGGTSYYIVPERDDPAATFPSARCLTLQAAALQRALPRIPAALRAQTAAIQAAFIAADRRLAAAGPQDVICVVTQSRNAGSTECGTTVAQIQHGTSPDDQEGTFSAVVPDGVATVTLQFPSAHGHPAHSVTATVHGNVYAVRVAGEGSGAPAAPPVAIWRSAQGHVIRTVTQPSPAAEAKLCRQHPVECLAVSRSSSSTGSSGSSSSSSSASATTTTPTATH